MTSTFYIRATVAIKNLLRSPISALIMVFAVVSPLAGAGCAHLGSSENLPVVELPPYSLAAEPALPDSLPAPHDDQVPVGPEIYLPVGPEGLASIGDLEDLYSTALLLGSQNSLGLARDHLFALQNHVNRPVREDLDPSYLEHLSSLQRRVWFLEGILAEKEAFRAPSGQVDSLLATGYGRLGNHAFPDSLVPATGITLNAFTADLMVVDNPAVRRWVEYFTGRGRPSFQHWLDRKSVVGELVDDILVENGLPSELVYLSIIESGLSSRAVSNVGAVGPWQFMPGTAKGYNLRNDWWADERRDLEMSTRAAVKHIQMLHDQFGDWALVLAAYNGGHGRVARKIRQHGHDNFWDMRLPSQTTAYVPKFIAAARVGADPEKYGFEIKDLPTLAYDVIRVDDATDLELIARCADVDPAVVRELNPALVRGASPPGAKNYPVKVPAGKGSRASRELKKNPADRRLTWRQHRVRRGETLGHIAREYGTSVSDIAKLNNMKDVHLIRPGNQLLIPMPAELAAQARQRSAEKGHYVPPSGYSRVSYKVKSGDNLGKIARKLGVTVKHLRKVNAIPQKHVIYPGQKLYAYRPGNG